MTDADNAEERKALADLLRAYLAATGEGDDSVNEDIAPGMTQSQLVDEIEQGTELGHRVIALLHRPLGGLPKTQIDPKIGDEQRDGTIFAGISPDTQRPMYTTPADAPLTYSFNEAAEYAETLNAQKFLGHEDWRVPTQDELEQLFNNRAAIGGFKETSKNPENWYWSISEDYDGLPWVRRFSDGIEGLRCNYLVSSLRCVRG